MCLHSPGKVWTARYKEAKKTATWKSGGKNKSWEHKQVSEAKAAYCSRPRALSTTVGVGRADPSSPSKPFLDPPLCTRAKSLQSCPTLWDPVDCSPTRLLCPWDSPDKNAGVGCHGHLRGIFLTQGSNLRLYCLLHRQVSSSPLAPPTPLPSPPVRNPGPPSGSEWAREPVTCSCSLLCGRGTNKALPGFLVWPLINFNWSRRPRITVGNNSN